MDSIKSLGQYYEVFKELNAARPAENRYKISAIFSFGANEDMDGKGDEHSADLLSRIMDDYNGMFGTSYRNTGKMHVYSAMIICIRKHVHMYTGGRFKAQV